ncbi:MAG: tetratricopeptide repeat protein [Methyloligellaceae bacterium]
MTLSSSLTNVRTPLLGLLLALLGAAAVALQPAPSRAAGDDIVKPTTVCPDGKVWSEDKNKCVGLKSGALPDRQLYQQGWRLAKAGHYEKAIRVLAAVVDQTNPKVLNYLGYSHRKMGRLAEGVAYYKKALAIDPDYVLAREYLGEGYVAAGRLQLAKDQLTEIGKRCGTHCKAYRQLAAVISGTRTETW